MTLLDYKELPEYPEEYISQKLLNIEPLLLMPSGDIYPDHRIHFEAFKNCQKILRLTQLLFACGKI